MRFLHLADVHLDTAFGGRSTEVRERLREASREAFRRAVDVALDESCHALLIAGDLFDGERLSFETERWLVTEVERLGERGVQLVYATGNHDPGRAGLRVHARTWPDHVTVVGDRAPRRLAIRDAAGATVGWVTAAGHPSARETDDLSVAFPRPSGDLPEVGLLHTQVVGARSADAHDPYAPSELERLRRAGFHYWALGHVHTRQCLSEDPPIHYPGNPQGRTPAERGARGGLLVDLADTRDPRVEFRPLGPVRWEDLTVAGLEEAHAFDALVRRIESAWRAERASDPWPTADGWIVRIRLSGGTPLWRELGRTEDRAVLERETADALGALEVEVQADATHPPLDPEAHRRRTDVLGEALRMLEAVRGGRERLPVDPSELAALELDPELEPEAWVRTLLEGAEGEVLARMLTEEALGGRGGPPAPTEPED